MLNSDATLNTPDHVGHSNFLEPTLILGLQDSEGLKSIKCIWIYLLIATFLTQLGPTSSNCKRCCSNLSIRNPRILSVSGRGCLLSSARANLHPLFWTRRLWMVTCIQQQCLLRRGKKFPYEMNWDYAAVISILRVGFHVCCWPTSFQTIVGWMCSHEDNKITTSWFPFSMWRVVAMLDH